MAKFENIVRPVVFPNIRPPARVRSVLEDDSQEDLFIEYVIRGGSGGPVDLPNSYNISVQRNRGTETKRRVDEVRVYQKEDDGTINHDNFVDLYNTTKVWVRTSGRGGTVNPRGQKLATAGGGRADTIDPIVFAPTEEADNIVIRKKDVILKNPKDQEAGAFSDPNAGQGGGGGSGAGGGGGSGG